jgi:3-oxoacyl-[acyl-carrier protein] reductase
VNLGIEGRVALVTGASKGLGLGVATALADEGARVAISSRSQERIDAAAARIGARGFVHDAADAGAAATLVSRVEQDLGSIDILVANSGGPPVSDDPLSFTLDQWLAAYEILLVGQIALIAAVLPGMRERGWGRVLSLSSGVVREPNPALILSSSHRAGLLAALKTIARQVAADGVTVNTLLMGVIDTERARAIGADSPQWLANIPMGRLGTVEEFAAAAAFLCSDAAGYITGTALPIDGGASRAV